LQSASGGPRIRRVPADAVQLDWVLLPFAAVFGAVVGSFLNAAVYRLPRNISLVKERRSFCPRCKAQIAWYDNVPILSYLVLLGRCRSCRQRISPRYLAVELLTAGLFAAVYWHVRVLNGAAANGGRALLGWEHLAVYLALVTGLVLAAFCDLEDYQETEEEKREATQRAAELRKAGKSLETEEGPSVYGIIPDEVTITGLVAALPLALFLPEVHWNKVEFIAFWPRLNAVFDAALGAVVGGGLIWGMGIFGKVVFKKAAMGWGDVKLLAMLGAILGWKAGLLIFFLAPVFGAIFGIAVMLMGGGHYLRYGPFLAAAAVLVIFYEPLASAYWAMAFGDGVCPELGHRVPFLGLEPDRGAM